MNNYGAEGVKYGVSFGTALAIAISYTNNHSILWAIIHGIFSWLYVIYFALFKLPTGAEAAESRRAPLPHSERTKGG